MHLSSSPAPAIVGRSGELARAASKLVPGSRAFEPSHRATVSDAGTAARPSLGRGRAARHIFLRPDGGDEYLVPDRSLVAAQAAGRAAGRKARKRRRRGGRRGGRR